MADRLDILVVEDSRPVAVLLQRALEGKGHRVTVLADGLDAHAAIQSNSFDIVLLDHLLPGMLGIELLEKVRADGLTVPILMLSGVAGESDIVQALRMGASDFIRKPFSLRELMARIDVQVRLAKDPRG